ncbi:MAG: pyridoxal kinase [Rhizobiales bacterium]|nr:pyridoxal kinase [Hyphomicrobiales bacterium]
MDTICISSQVAYGPVGNSAAVPALEHAGFTVIQVPTTVLSNHPGHCPPAATDVTAETLEKTLEILIQQGWLDRCGAVMTGYFRDRHQIEVAARAIGQLKRRNPTLIYLCDPVMGDDHTDLYVPLPVANAIRDELLPLADIITPNRFELQWLTGTAVGSLEAAVPAARTLPCPVILATSLPAAFRVLDTAVIEPGKVTSVATSERASAPHGAGDILAGLLLAAVLRGNRPAEVLGQVMASLEHILDASSGTAALALPTALNGIEKLAALPVEITND